MSLVQDRSARDMEAEQWFPRFERDVSGTFVGNEAHIPSVDGVATAEIKATKTELQVRSGGVKAQESSCMLIHLMEYCTTGKVASGFLRDVKKV